MGEVKISAKLTGVVMVTVGTMFAALSVYAYIHGRDIYLNQASNIVQAVRTSRVRSLEAYFTRTQHTLDSSAESPRVQQMLREMPPAVLELPKELSRVQPPQAADTSMRAYYEGPYRDRVREAGIPWEGADRYFSIPRSNIVLQSIYLPPGAHALALQKAAGQTHYGRLYQTFDKPSSDWANAFGLYDIFLIDTAGNVVYTVRKEIDFGTNVKTGPFRKSGLAQAFLLASRSSVRDQTYFTDCTAYEPTVGASACFASVPVFGTAREGLLGVYIAQLSGDALNGIVGDREGLGSTGECYLVGPDMLMRTDSRSVPNAILRLKVETEAVRRGLRGESGVIEQTGYLGNRTLAAFSPMNAGSMHWVVVAKIEYAELMAPARQLALRVAAVMTFCSLGCVVLLYLSMDRLVIRHLKALAGAAKNIEEGHLGEELPITTRDEFGQLYRTFNGMVRSVNTQSKELVTLNTALGMVHTSLEGVILRCNPRFAEIIGRPAQEIPGTTVQAITPAEDWPASRQMIAGLSIRGSGPASMEKRYLRPDGSHIWTRVTSSLRLGADGQPSYLFTLVEDIQSLKTAEAALLQAEQKFREIYEHAPEGIFQTTPTGKSLTLNPAGAKMLGYLSPEDAVAAIDNSAKTTWSDPKHREEYIKLLEKDGEINSFATQLRCKDGTTIWVALSAPRCHAKPRRRTPFRRRKREDTLLPGFHGEHHGKAAVGECASRNLAAV